MRNLLEMVGNFCMFMCVGLVVFILALGTADETVPLAVTSAVFCALAFIFWHYSKVVR